METLEIERNCCDFCLFNKKGFLIKNKKQCKVYNCLCLKNKLLYLCEECKKQCHFTEGHKTTEVTNRTFTNFMCACSPNNLKDSNYNMSTDHGCLFSKIFKDQKTFFKVLRNSKNFICFWCENTCLNNKKFEIINDPNAALFTCSCSKNHSNRLENSYEIINKIFLDADSIINYGKRVNLMRIINTLKNFEHTKIDFDIFREISINLFEQFKFGEYQEEEVRIICYFFIQFLKKYYSFYANTLPCDNVYVSELINYETVKKMFKNVTSLDIKLKFFKVFKYSMFRQLIPTKFFLVMKDKNINPLHRLMFGSTEKEIFRNSKLITKEMYYELMEMLINTLNENIITMDQENSLNLFNQYIEMLELICYFKDINLDYITKGNEKIKNFIDYILKYHLTASNPNYIKRRNSVIKRLESLYLLLFLKINDNVLYRSMKNDSNERTNDDIEDKFVFQNNNELSTMMMSNLFSFVDKNDQHVSKIDILELSTSKKDFYEESLKNLIESNFFFPHNMISLIREDYAVFKEYNNLVQVYDMLNEKFTVDLKEYTNGNYDEKKIHNELKGIIEELDKNLENMDRTQDVLLLMYKIGYLDLVINILKVYLINKFLKKTLSFDEFNAFYEGVLMVIEKLIHKNPFLIRIILSKYYFNILFIKKKQSSLISFIYFLERQLKVIRDTNFKADVVDLCYVIGDNYVAEYIAAIKPLSNNKKEYDAEFIIKICMIMSCFKVCIDVSIYKTVYIINKKLFSTLKSILTTEYIVKIDRISKKLVKISLFNHILYKIANSQDIIMTDKENYSHMSIDEMEFYFLKNIVDLINSLQMEFFNLLCSYIDFDLIYKLCSNINLFPIVRKALVNLYCKNNFGNYFNQKTIIPKDADELVNFDLVIEKKDKIYSRYQSSGDFDENKIDLIENEEDERNKQQDLLLSKCSSLESSVSDDEKIKLSENKNNIKFELEKKFFEFIIENLQNFPLVLNKFKNYKSPKIQKNIYNFFLLTINEPSCNAVFRALSYPTLTKEMNVTIYKIVIYYIKCYHLLLVLIKEEFLKDPKDRNESMRLFKIYITFDFTDDHSAKENMKKEQINKKSLLYELEHDKDINDIEAEALINEKTNYLWLNHLDKRLDSLVKKIDEIEREYIYNHDIKLLLSYYKELLRECNKSYGKNSQHLNKNKIITNSLKNIINDYRKKKRNFADHNIMHEIFYKQENTILKSHIFYSLFRELDIKKGLNEIPSIDDQSVKRFSTFYDAAMRKTGKKIIMKSKTSKEMELYKAQEKDKFNKPSKNILILEIINKIMKIDPSFCQNILKKIIKNKYFFKLTIQDKFIYLIQLCISDFKILDNRKNINHTFLYKLVEFFRLMCEDHNKSFQTFLMNYNYKFDNSNQESVNFLSIIFSYLTKILKNVEFFAEREELLDFLVISKKNYFTKILKKMTELLVEMIQGTYRYNFSNNLMNTKNEKFSEYNKHVQKIMDEYDRTREDDYEPLIKNFFIFGITFLDEETNKNSNKKRFLKDFNMNQIMHMIIFLMKKFYFQVFSEKDYISDELPVIDKINSIILCDVKCEKIKKYYLTTNYEEMNACLYLAMKIYFFIKLAQCYEKNFSQIEKEFLESEIAEEPTDFQKNLKQIYKFFCMIIKQVEVTHKVDSEKNTENIESYTHIFLVNNMYKILEEIKNDNNDERKNSEIINRVFIIKNLSIYLENSDILTEILENTPIDDIKKLEFLMNSINDLKGLFKAREHFDNNYKYIYKILKIDPNIVLDISCWIIILINILLTFSLKHNEDNIVTGSLDSVIMYVSTLHVIFLSLYLIFIIFFNFIKIRNSQKTENISEKRQISYFEFLNKSVNSRLMWNLVFGILGLCGGKFTVFYSIQLISVFYLSSTMTCAVKTMQLKFSQFAATILIIILLSLLFASLGFNYYNDLYFKEDLKYNMCNSFFHCFLTILGWGFINGSVDFANMKSINDPTYWDHFAFSWSYYFLISIIMVNIINAIIVNTFQDLRVESNEKIVSLENTCFICSNHRTKFEIKGIDFSDHIKVEHNLINYIHYLIRISEVDKKNLNSNDSYCKECFEDKRTNFFPIKSVISSSKK